MADWIYSDRTQLHIHVVRFQDATLVTQTCLHTLMDTVGRSALLKSWCAVLGGREGDVLASWWVKTVVTALQPTLNRPIMLMTVCNTVSLFSEWPLDGSAYIGNAFFPCYTILPAYRVLEKPMGVVARETRQDQVQALAAIQRASFRMTTPLLGRSDLLFLAYSNLHKARFFELDFSTAVVAPGVLLNDRSNGLGRPSYINIIEHSPLYPTRNVLRVIGKDSTGDWWVTSSVRAEAWSAIDRHVIELGN